MKCTHSNIQQSPGKAKALQRNTLRTGNPKLYCVTGCTDLFYNEKLSIMRRHKKESFVKDFSSSSGTNWMLDLHSNRSNYHLHQAGYK